MHSTNALVMCIKMEIKRMPRSKFLKLTCQDFWKPMKIENRFQRANATPRKLVYLNRIQMQSIVCSLWNLCRRISSQNLILKKNCFGFEIISNLKKHQFLFKLPRKKTKQKQTGDCLRFYVHVSLWIIYFTL